MIEIAKTYKFTLTEEQTRQLHQLLLDTKDIGNFHLDGRFSDLRSLYNELKELFDV